MPLLPEDVHKKTFTPVRLREGYDTGEVDSFLDEVHAELTRLHAENEDLRTHAEVIGGLARPEGESSPVSGASPAGGAPAVTPAEVSTRAARLLEIAAGNADQLVDEAREEADRLHNEARMMAERLESDARTRAEKLEAETSDRRNQLFGELEQEREALSRSLDDLRAQERDVRNRLKGYFEAQLQVLNGNSDASVTAAMLSEPDLPPRLRELFSEDTGS
jgi:DivIVA domain-containing protein